MTEYSDNLTNIEPDLSTVQIKVLRLATRNLISSLLNPLKVLPNENGLPRDWRGLAHLIGLKVEKIPVIACDSDPTSRVLTLWQKLEDSTCTIKQLHIFLADLDRFDIIDDAHDLIVEDIQYFFNEPEKVHCQVSMVNNDVDRHILTVDDVNNINHGLRTQTYDAFVVFADEDIDFATELIDTMEKQFGLKLCVKERDLVAGLHFEHKAIIELISERCNRLIVIISPAYLRSSANKFVVNYAQALGIEQGRRKIIPCLYEPCEELPQELRHMFMLNYQRSGKLYNFWDRLKHSIQAPSIQSSPRLQAQSQHVSRPISQEIKANYTEMLPDLKPALVNPQKNHLKVKKSKVKFGSCTNITVLEPADAKRSVSVNALHSEEAIAIDDVVTIPVDTKKGKNKLNWLKKLINHKDNDKKTCNGAGVKEKKKKSWLKIKVPVI